VFPSKSGTISGYVKTEISIESVVPEDALNMKIGIPKEIFEDERRVAATPPSVHKLVGLGYDVIVEGSAGEAANYSDAAYEKVGAAIATDTSSL